MRQSSLLLSLLFLWTAGIKGQSLIPSPLTYQPLTGSHPLERTYRIEPESKAVWRDAKAAGWDLLQHSPLTGRRGHTPVRSKARGIISLAAYVDDPRPEAYALRITPDTLWVQANTGAGWRHALTTLQWLADEGRNAIPCVSIEDAPALAWRGVMLDVSRHFYPVSTLYNVIDWLARYKMNRLHLHLTDAAGWRMEIKRYPLLTKQAAWRDAALWKTWWNGSRAYAHEGDSAAYGGYYTQNELRLLVKYASQRGVTIVPEIEMPAHSEEVTAAYPFLSCTHDPKGQADFCPGNDSTFTFLEHVLDEVMEVFPSADIHVGGDEAGKAAWPTCPRCTQRVKDEALPSVEALQGYLIRRVADYARRAGNRRIVAWDEVLDDSLAQDVQVMVWRDTSAVRKAIARGHDVILAPGAFCYLDAYQDDPSAGPEANGAYRPLSRVYAYRPLSALSPDERQHVRGIQGCLWTEYVPTTADVERMLLPRMMAIAENGWTGGETKNFAHFRQRAEAETNRLRAQGVNAFNLSAEIGDRAAARQTVEHKARGAKVIYHRPYSNTYAAGGDSALTDGRRGGWDYGTGTAWQGFISRGRLDVTLDLGAVTDVNRVALDFLQTAGPEIYLPAHFSIAAQDDDGRETMLFTHSEAEVRHTLPSVETLEWRGHVRTRFLHVRATNGPLGGWIFTDEIVVE